MIRINELFKNILSLSVVRGLEYIMAFICFPYLVRVLQVEHYGLLIFAETIAKYFVLFTDYGFNFLGPKKLSQHDSVQERGLIFSNIFYAKILLLLLSGVVFWGGLFCLQQFYRVDIVLYGVFFLMVIGSVFFPIWFFQGLQQMHYITYANVFANGIRVIGIFLWVHTPDDYLRAAFFQALGPVIAAFASWIIIIKKYPDVIRKPNIIGIKKALQEGWVLFTTTIAINIYTASSVVFLGMVTNNTVVGYFSGAKRIIDSITNLIWPISQAVYPYVSKRVAESKAEAISLLQKMTRLLGAGSLAVSCFIFIWPQFIVNILLGEGYGESIAMLRIMAFMPFIIALSNVFAIQTMLVFGLQNEFNKIVFKAAALNIGLIFPLSYLLGGLGAGAALVITECYVTFASWFCLKTKGINLLILSGYTE